MYFPKYLNGNGQTHFVSCEWCPRTVPKENIYIKSLGISLEVELFDVADSLGVKAVGCVYFIVVATDGPQVLLGKSNVADKFNYCLMAITMQILSAPKI